MENAQSRTGKWLDRIVSLFLFLGIGSLIILVFSPWRPMFKNNDSLDYLGRLAVAVVLLIVVLLVQNKDWATKYKPLLTALWILSVAVLVDVVFGVFLIKHLNVTDAAPKGWAAQKLNESVIVVLAILILNKTWGGSLGSIYVQKGNLKLGLIIGIATFVLAAAGSIPMATLFNAKDLTIARIVPWIPWILIIVLSNGVLEEVMFRGLFLRKLEPFWGKFMSNLLVALLFTVLHGTVTYTADNLIFVAVLFPLALLWGYVMQKTDSIWGSVLFHAGMDIPIFLGIFSNL